LFSGLDCPRSDLAVETVRVVSGLSSSLKAKKAGAAGGRVEPFGDRAQTFITTVPQVL